MKYDFTTLADRSGTGSLKWDEMRRECPGFGPDIVPFSVADMELLPPPELVDGLKDCMGSMIFGYTAGTDSYYESVQDWMEARHGFRPPREWFMEYPGVVPALRDLIAQLTAPQDSVLILTPVYYPFRGSIKANRRTVVECGLVRNGRTYDIDFADLERRLARPEVTMMLLCSPHNPVGRVWTADELARIAGLCRSHHVLLVSDEIHFDLIMPGYTHVSAASLTGFLDNIIVCTAPSKTFNLAGLQTSNLFIPNEEIRAKLQKARGFFTLNCVGYKACELAYTRCGGWLDQLILHLDSNRKLVEDAFRASAPEFPVFELQGTYLQWLDFRALGLSAEELKAFMHRAGWYCDEGSIFGTGGAGFERLNLACPASVLEAALDRLFPALNAWREEHI